MKRVKSIRQTCNFCPSQWEGELENGQDFYIRYRWGCLSLDIPFGTTVFEKELGDGLSGVLSTRPMIEELAQHLDFSNAEQVELEDDWLDWQQTQEDARNSGRP